MEQLDILVKLFAFGIIMCVGYTGFSFLNWAFS